MTDQFTKQFIAMRYWLLGKEYFVALNALEFASQYHTGTRKDGETPEYFHQLSIGRYVKSIATSLDYPEETIAAAFLHDIQEDYDISDEEIISRFGERSAIAVRLLTKVFRGHRKPDSEYYHDLTDNKIASIAKGADRIHNIQTMVGVFTLEKQQEYIEETETYVLPAIKEARRRFPSQEPAYENIRHVLVSQIELLRAVHQAAG